MGKTKIVLDLQSDLILNNALIVRPSGIVKSDLPGLVDDINGLTMSIASEASARAAADQQLSNDLSDLQNYVDTTVDSAIATLTSDLADEAAARITADAGLDGRINDIISNTNAPIIDSFTEVVAQMEAMPGVDESSIVVDSENNISLKDTVAAPASGVRTFGGLVNVGSEPSLDENFVNLSLVTKGYVTGLVDAEEAARIADVDAEEARATNAENVLNAALSTEIARAYDAEGVLQSNIDVEKGRIDSILLASDADKDSFAEIVSLINSVDTTNDQAFAGYVLSNDAALAAEVSRAQDAETSIIATFSAAISTETSARIAADVQLSSDLADLQTYVDTTFDSTIATLTSDLADETAARIADVDAEETRALAAEAQLSSDLAGETFRAQIAETAISADLVTETNRATTAETLLQSNIDVEKGRIDAILLASDADKDNFAEIVTLINSVDTENDQVFAGYVLSNDAALSSLSATFSAALSTEEAARIADVDAEEARALAAEALLQAAIDAEATARLAADAGLDGRINDIISNTNAPIIDSFTEVVAQMEAMPGVDESSIVVDSENNISLKDTVVAPASGIRTFNGLVNVGSEPSLDENFVDLSLVTKGYVTGLVDAEEAARIDAVANEEARATIQENVLNAALSTEIARAYDAEGVLQSNIDVEKGRIDAILQGSDVNLDQFAEVVTFVQSIDLSNDDALLNAVIGIEDSISDEAAERQAADSAIEDSISSLESNINSELSTLSNSLNTEIENRISDIETVEGSITDLTETLDAAVLTINDSIDAVIASVAEEHAHHTAAEVTLQANIDIEKGRIDAILQGSDVDLDQFKEVVDFVNSIDLENDDALMSAIINIENSISQEISNRESADSAIESTISSLEGTLFSEISLLTSSLDTEVSDRISAIETVESAIDDLTETVDSAVLTINNSIDDIISDLDTEVTRATTAEGVLQTNIDTEKARIDAILQGSDVNLDQFVEIVDFVQSIDLTNDDALLNVVIGIENSISDEASARQATDSAIEDTISSLESNINSELSTLSNSLNTEIENRISDIETVESAIADLTETVDTAIIEINDSIDAEVVRATAAEAALDAAKLNLAGGTMSGDITMTNNTLGAMVVTTNFLGATVGDLIRLESSLDFDDSRSIINLAAPTNGGDAANKTYVDAADATLQSNIDTEKSRIDAILQGSDVDLDQFAEVVTFVQSIDLSNDDALLNAVTSINDAIDAEVVRATAAEEALDAAKLDLAGGTMTGDITMGGNKIYDVNHIYTGSVTTDRFYSNNSNGILVNTNLSLDGNSIKNLAEPIANNDAARKGYVDAGDARLSSDLADETAARIADVDAEETRALAAEAALSTDISTLQTYVDTTVDSAIATLTSDLADETAARIADVDAEEARALAAEGVLQSNIDVEKGRIDSILLASDADKDSFAEIVSLINSVDTTNDQAFAGYVLSNDAALAAEVSRAQDIESSIIATFSAAISTETAARIADVDAEETRALAAEAALSSDLADLQSYVDTTVDSAISTLTSDLADETSARIADVDAEETRAIAAEAALSATFSTALSAETFRATAAEIQLSNDLSDETSYRLDADTLLQSNIDVEKGRIDAILLASDADKDSFAEIVTLINSVDTTNDTAFASYVLSNNASLSSLSATFSAALSTEEAARIADVDAEEARALAAELVLTNDLADEILRATIQENVLNAALSTEIARAYDAEAVLQSNINAEVTRATTAEALLQTNINTEANERMAEDITLQGNIDIEAARAQAAETAIATDLGTEIAARIAAVSSEETRAMLAEAALSATFSAAISTEATRAIAAEGVLQSNIDVEKSRIDAILIGASASADNFAEIVSLINSVDTTNDQVFAGYVLSNDAALAAEISRATTTEATLSATFSAAISTEVSRATAAELVLTNDLATEVSRATAAEGVLTSALSVEETSRIAGDSALQSSLNNEIADRIAAGQSAQSALDSETVRAIAAEGVLTSDLASEVSRAIAAEATLSATFSAALASETFRATAAEIQLSNNLSDETSYRLAADTLLQSNIDVEKSRIDAILIGASASADNFAEIVTLINSVDTTNDQVFAGYVLSNDAALAAEVSRATTKEDYLEAALSGEINGRVTGDAALAATFSAAISTETTARIAADTALATDFTNIYCKKVAVTGTPNGVLTTFTLALSVRIGSEMIYVNGLLMEEGEDYTTIVTSGKVSGVEFFIAPVSEMKVRAYGVCGI